MVAGNVMQEVEEVQSKLAARVAELDDAKREQVWRCGGWK